MKEVRGRRPDHRGQRSDFGIPNYGITELRNCGIVELWNCGIVELWNCGIVELWNWRSGFQPRSDFISSAICAAAPQSAL